MNLQNQINYLQNFLNIDMFDDCTVPQGLNMERVRGAIVMRCGLLTPLYNEPETQRAATQQFFFENQWNFQHIINILNADYSPIENVAEWRDETTTNKGGETLNITHSNTEQNSGADVRNINEENSGTDTRKIISDKTETESIEGTESRALSGNENNSSDTNSTETENIERTISAENVGTYSPDNQETSSKTLHGEISETKKSEGSDVLTLDKTDKIVTHDETSDDLTYDKKTDTDDTLNYGKIVTNNGADTHNTDKNSETNYSVFRHGNVGVTTNQQMINEELDLLERFNPYKFIADLYEKELILGLY